MPILLIQLIALALWAYVPAFASVPLWVVFIPAIYWLVLFSFGAFAYLGYIWWTGWLSR